jgi:hypothetical protein
MFPLMVQLPEAVSATMPARHSQGSSAPERTKTFVRAGSDVRVPASCDEQPHPRRSAVRAAQAKRDGSMRVWSTSYNHMAAAKSVKSRADVQGEVLGADRAATTALTGEDSGSFALSRQRARQAGTVLAAR